MDEAAAQLLSSLLKDNIASIASLGKSGAARLREHLLQSSGLAFRAYYELASKKYALTKTILYRTTPVRLYEYYVHTPLGLSGGRVIDTEHVSRPLLVSSHCIITGTAGSGKSTLLRHFFLDALNAGSHLPLLIELRLLNEEPELSLPEFMHLALSRLGLDLTPSQLEKMLEGGRFLILFDAFDELNSELAIRIEQEIIRFRDRYARNAIVVSSRPDERFVAWNNFTEMRVLPLSKDRAMELIAKLEYDSAIKQLFLKAIKENLYETHRSFLEVPLLLTLMLMTYDQFGDIPQKMHLFYAQVFDTLFTKHDATKGGYRREMLCALPSDEFQDLLSAFSVITYFKNQTTFSRPEILDYLATARQVLGGGIEFDPEEFLGDLLRSLCILLQEGLQYIFAHRTFQEYFTARYIIRSGPEQRSALLRKLAFRIRQDTAFRLAWEMDKRAVEDDFLIAALSDVAARTHYDASDSDEAFVRYVRLVYSAINLNDDDEQSFSLTIAESSIFHLTHEILNLYENGRKPPYPWPGAAEVQGFLQRVSALMPEEASDQPVIIHLRDDQHPLVGNTSIHIDTVLEGHDLRVALLDLLKPVRWQYDRAMNHMRQMMTKKRARESSVEELLLSGRPVASHRKSGEVRSKRRK